MEKRIEIIPFLAGIVKENAPTHQTNLIFDEKRLQAAMLETNRENRVFLWMCRSCGTWCVLEREVFLKASDAFMIWTHPDCVAEADRIKAYRIAVAPGGTDSVVLGTVQPINYAEHIERVKRFAVPIHQVTVTFKSGETRTMAYKDYQYQFPALACDTKCIEHIQYQAKDESRLSGILYLEHHPLNEHPRRPTKRTIR